MKASDLDEARIIELISLCNNAECDTHEIATARGWGAYHSGRPGCYTLGPYAIGGAIPRLSDQIGEPRPHWANVLDLVAQLDVPRKVLLVKLCKMINRAEVIGCACGCRGDLIAPGTKFCEDFMHSGGHFGT